MESQKSTYKVLILADEPPLAHMLATLLGMECGTTEVVDSEAMLWQQLALAHYDMVLMATTVPFATDALIEHKVRHIHKCGARLLVMLRSTHYRHTLRLLGAGVDCCMAQPISLHRLHRIVLALLDDRIRRVE